MKRQIAMIGKGFVYGVKHPFLDEPMKRTKDMTTIDGLCGDIGMSLSQGTIQTVIGYGGFILLLVGFGYLNNKMKKTDIKATMVVEPKTKKKK